jgi:DNA-binding MarR family transcriptional regulator
VADPEQIEELNTGLLLFIPYRAMEARVFKALAAKGYDDFTPAQARVFQRIAPGGSRLTDLAEQALITKQSAGFLVDQLERAGYVERVPDPSNARARLIRIAERGRQMLPLVASVVSEVEAEWTEHLGKRRMGQLPEVLARGGATAVGVRGHELTLNEVGYLHARWIVRDRGHQTGSGVPVASTGGRVPHPHVACAVLGVGGSHRALSQRDQQPSISCCCHDSHRRHPDHHRAARVLGRRGGGQVDHQGLHHQAGPRGHLVHAPSRRHPRSARRRQRSE